MHDMEILVQRVNEHVSTLCGQLRPMVDYLAANPLPLS